MRANELMIGDWVYNALYVDTEIPNKGHGWKAVRVPNLPFDEEWAIEPIPLTEEMLEMNGFEEYRYGVCQSVRYRIITETDTVMIEPMKVKSRLGNKWYWFDNKTRKFEIVKPHVLYPLVYVHELQHALRLCGLTELADNFKV